MPAIFSDSNKLALLRSLAERGDQAASALMALLDNTYYVQLSAAAEAAEAIVITGQVKDQDGNDVAGVKDVLVTSIPIAGTGLLTDAGDGSIKAGSGTVRAWVETAATGRFQLSVANAEAEDNLIVVELDNGTTEMLKLTFA